MLQHTVVLRTCMLPDTVVLRTYMLSHTVLLWIYIIYTTPHSHVKDIYAHTHDLWYGTNIYHENASVIGKTPFNYTYRSQKTKDFVKLKMRFSNYRSIFIVNVAY